MPGLAGTIRLDPLFLLDVSAVKHMETRPGNLPSKLHLPGLDIPHCMEHMEAVQSGKGSIEFLYEGRLLGMNGSANSLSDKLLHLYLRDGELFVDRLRGSFQIVVLDKKHPDPKCLLYCDHKASHPLFYTYTDEEFQFSPTISELIPHAKTRTTDEMAMIHFMVSGHFPAGRTGIEEIKMLGPGEYLRIQNGRVEKKQYFRYTVDPDGTLDDRQALDILDRVLTGIIRTHWENALSPVILLSGGYDSQYIFYTIAEAVKDASKLTTVTWGVDPRRPGSDMVVARRTAGRFGTRHIEIIKKTDDWRQEYDDMFIAQNGMTDSSFYHAHELTVCKKLRDEYGIRSVMRGDECLGYGPVALTAQNALAANSLSFPQYVSGIDGWFEAESQVVKRYGRFMADLVERYGCASYDSLKDTLDFYERQHMNRNPLNHFKLKYLDVYNPLIDPDVLMATSRFPARFRAHKQLFKRALTAKVGRKLKIAANHNLENWHGVIRRSPEMAAFLNREFDKLPDFFNRDFFRHQLRLIRSGKKSDPVGQIRQWCRPLKSVLPIERVRRSFSRQNGCKDQPLSVPSHQLVIRAAVLARWNDWWIGKGAGQTW